MDQIKIEKCKKEEMKLIQDIEYILGSIKWPEKNPMKDRTRMNVVGHKEKIIKAFVLGKVHAYHLTGTGKLANSINNKKFPELYTKLKQLMRIHNPSFRFNAIQLNNNVQTCPHHDKNNKGVSYAFACGKHTGGGLRIFKNEKHVDYPNRHKWILYNGSKLLHGSVPVRSGVRYALIFYSSIPR